MPLYGDNKQVRVTEDDTTPGFLSDKIAVTGAGLGKSVETPAGDEDLQLAIATANVSTLAPNGSNTEGDANSLARSNHVHRVGSGAFDEDLILITDGAGGWDTQEKPGAAFGTQLTTAESEGLSSTSSGTYQQKLTMTTPDLPEGEYLLLFQMLVSGTSNNTRTEVRVHLDNTTNIAEFIVRLVIASGAYQSSGHKVLMSFSGVHTFDIDYRKDGGSGSAQISWARLAFWRIA